MKKVKNIPESKKADLNHIYNISKALYFRITKHIEENRIKDFYYKEDDWYLYIFFKTTGGSLEVISYSKGDIANDPKIEHIIMFSGVSKELKKFIESKRNVSPTELSESVFKVEGYPYKNTEFAIKEKTYEISYVKDGKEGIVSVKGGELNGKIKELREQGYGVFNIFDDRSSLSEKKKEPLKFAEIFNQINDMSKEQVREIMEQCMRVL